MNSDGTIIAIGADLGFSERGGVFVYRYDAGTWIRLGSTIKGSTGSLFGKRVSMNGAGDVLAVAAPNEGQNGCGMVYSYDGADWVQMGNDMCGSQANENFGWRLGLSGESTTTNAMVAFGSNLWKNRRGRVLVYSYDAGTDSWTEMVILKGESDNDRFNNIAISNDGTTIAIGSGVDYFKVYQYAQGSWTQIGTKTEGNMTGEGFGQTVALSGDGMTLVACAKNGLIGGARTGYIKIYKYDYLIGDWQEWVQINGGSDGDNFGVDASVNYDGSILVVGAHNMNGIQGCGYVYQYNDVSSVYVQVSPTGDDAALMCGDTAGDKLSRGTAISSDGSSVAFASMESQYARMLKGVSVSNVVFLHN